MAYNLTDQFLSALLTTSSQRRLRIKSSGVQAQSNNQSELSRRTYSVENISTSSSSTSSPLNCDANLSMITDLIHWAVELLLRLLLPGTIIYDNHFSCNSINSSLIKESINQVWFKLYALNDESRKTKNQHNSKTTTTSRSSCSMLNPVSAFVILSLQTVNTSAMGSENRGTVDNNDCQFWRLESQTLNTLIQSIFSCKHFKLCLRSLFILFKQMSTISSTPSALLSSLWSTLNESLLHSLIDSSSPSQPLPPATLETSLSSDEEQQRLRQFLSILEQFSENPLLSSSSSSTSRSTDYRILLPYLLIGMFIELIRMNSLNLIDILYILQSLLDILLNRIDCFNNVQMIVLFNILLTFEYWSRVKLSPVFLASSGSSTSCGSDTMSTTSAASVAVATAPPSVSYHINNIEEYKAKLRLMNSTIYQNSQVKLKVSSIQLMEILLLHKKNIYMYIKQ
ncbi:unnamed protein product [Trichobilharzia regenti]|nr:unnamed protein product [Trichobilharzia regenti]